MLNFQCIDKFKIYIKTYYENVHYRNNNNEAISSLWCICVSINALNYKVCSYYGNITQQAAYMSGLIKARKKFYDHHNNIGDKYNVSIQNDYG